MLEHARQLLAKGWPFELGRSQGSVPRGAVLCLLHDTGTETPQYTEGPVIACEFCGEILCYSGGLMCETSVSRDHARQGSHMSGPRPCKVCWEQRDPDTAGRRPKQMDASAQQLSRILSTANCPCLYLLVTELACSSATCRDSRVSLSSVCGIASSAAFGRTTS